jgi:hypothetical protein
VPRLTAPPAAALGLALLSCGGPPALPDEPQFVRGGLIVPAGAAPAGAGQPLADGRVLLTQPWVPGAPVELAGPGGAVRGTAPLVPECAALFRVPLGDLRAAAARGAPAPDTALGFSPDGRWLAVGTADGTLLVVDGWTGAARARRRLPEAMVKGLAWSADGAALYVAEQSPEATLRAVDPATLADRWALRLADRVEPSAAPAGEDLFGVYSLPAGFGLDRLPDGALLVAAAHSWRADGAHRNLSQLLKISPDGVILDQWPAAPVDATLLHPRASADGSALALVVGRSAEGPPPSDLPIPAVALLSAAPLGAPRFVQTPALGPWFSAALVWEALALDVEADVLAIGFADGRVALHHADGRPRALLSPGAPVLAGELPLAASVGAVRIGPGQVVFTTTYTQIPFGAAAPDLRPTGVHPAENTLWSVNLDGSTRWRWAGGHRLEALARGPGPLLAAAAGARTADDRRDLFGVLVFDLDTPAGGDPLALRCPTASPVTFAPAWAPDGRIAVATHPAKGADGQAFGDYDLLVLR